MNLKLLIWIITLSISIPGFSQRYMSDSTYVRFFSEAPLENIDAVTNDAASAIDLSTGRLAFNVPIKSFEFDKSLMQDHFNENYMESDKYPKATFTGKINDWDGQKGLQDVIASGEMTIHGVTQQVEVKGRINYQEDAVRIESVFPVKLEDYKVKIPKAVFYNIAEVVEVTVLFTYKPL